jgi:hypothetical protein
MGCAALHPSYGAVIRSEDAYLNIARYIEANPWQWLDDVYHSPTPEPTT